MKKDKNQLTGTATEPHRNRKFRQFNNDQFCNNQQMLKPYSTEFK